MIKSASAAAKHYLYPERRDLNMRHIKAFLVRISAPAKRQLPLLLAALAFISYTGLVGLIVGHCVHAKTESAVAAKYEEILTALKTELQNE